MLKRIVFASVFLSCVLTANEVGVPEYRLKMNALTEALSTDLTQREKLDLVDDFYEYILLDEHKELSTLNYINVLVLRSSIVELLSVRQYDEEGCRSMLRTLYFGYGMEYPYPDVPKELAVAELWCFALVQ